MEPKFDDEVAMDEYVLVTTDKEFQIATQFLGEYDFRQCLLHLDRVWAKGVKQLRKKLGERPSQVVRDRASKLPTVQYLVAHPREGWKNQVPFIEFERACEIHGFQFNELGCWAMAYLELLESTIISDVAIELEVEVNSALEDMGLYIGKGRAGVVATADRKLESPMPALPKLSPARK